MEEHSYQEQLETIKANIQASTSFPHLLCSQVEGLVNDILDELDTAKIALRILAEKKVKAELALEEFKRVRGL